MSDFLLQPNLHRKIICLCNPEIDQDIKSLSVIKMLQKNSLLENAIFAMVIFPLLVEKKWLNKEALMEVSKIFQKVTNLDGELKFQNTPDKKDRLHPFWENYKSYWEAIPDKEFLRKKRIRQLLEYLVVHSPKLLNPREVEAELNLCFNELKNYIHVGLL